MDNDNGEIISLFFLPPLVGAHIGGASKPGVQDKNAPECFTSSDTPQEGRIITQTKSFPEPVNGQLPAWCLSCHRVFLSSVSHPHHQWQLLTQNISLSHQLVLTRTAQCSAAELVCGQARIILLSDWSNFINKLCDWTPDNSLGNRRHVAPSMLKS